jgi:uncharacterized phage protein (TIGR02216 family)
MKTDASHTGSPPPSREGGTLDRTPWAEWLRAGLFALGLTPADFWRLSLAEWRALAGAGDGAPTADELRVLMRAHPDRARGESER